MGKAYHEGHILHSGSILTQESSSYFLYSLNWDGVIRIKKVEILLMEFQVEFGLGNLDARIWKLEFMDKVNSFKKKKGK